MRAALILVLLASSAHAEPWYRGRYGTNRVVHLTVAVTGTVLYPLTASVQDDLAPAACRWCDPTALDRSVRDSARWHDVGTATKLSDGTAYVALPALATGLVLAGTLAEPSTAAVLDDLVPVLETVAITRWATRGLKLAFGRQRPYAHYVGPEDEDDNLSFPSGHTSTAFAIAVSAAVVAQARTYRTAPVLWGAGLALAGATGYLRIAADRHYVTDVVAGAALGAAAGLTVPLLMKRGGVAIVPTRGGAAFAGAW